MSPCPSLSLLLVSFLTSSTLHLQMAVPTAHLANLRGLGLISIKLLWHNVTDTRSYTKKLLKSEKMDPFIKPCLQDCLELYSDAVPTLKQAIRTYKDKKHRDVNIDLSSVMDASMTWEDGFAEKGAASLLAERNKDEFQLPALDEGDLMGVCVSSSSRCFKAKFRLTKKIKDRSCPPFMLVPYCRGVVPIKFGIFTSSIETFPPTNNHSKKIKKMHNSSPTNDVPESSSAGSSSPQGSSDPNNQVQMKNTL
ncbi:hypothetical protein NL676_012023 [Syzygium grande]|nr:hypothetical protein NL676_012023 [Syzygium grande]